MKKVRLAFSGSGFLAPIHAGAAAAFMDAGVQIVEVAGTSGGSIAAALIASGKSSADLKRISLAEIPDNIMSVQPFGALFRWAINDGKVLHAWLRDSIGLRTFNEATMPVTIVASDVRRQQGVVFSHRRTPSLLLADGCRMSASVPGIWAPVRYEGILAADGGMSVNIPVDKLRIDDVPRVGIDVTGGTQPARIRSLVDYAKACIATMLGTNEGNLIAWARQTGAHVVPVNADPYNFLDAGMPLAAKAELFSRGYQAVEEFLDGRRNRSLTSSPA